MAASCEAISFQMLAFGNTGGHGQRRQRHDAQKCLRQDQRLLQRQSGKVPVPLERTAKGQCADDQRGQRGLARAEAKRGPKRKGMYMNVSG